MLASPLGTLSCFLSVWSGFPTASGFRAFPLVPPSSQVSVSGTWSCLMQLSSASLSHILSDLQLSFSWPFRVWLKFQERCFQWDLCGAESHISTGHEEGGRTCEKTTYDGARAFPCSQPSVHPCLHLSLQLFMHSSFHLPLKQREDTMVYDFILFILGRYNLYA